jgi:hypothetical protein
MSGTLSATTGEENVYMISYLKLFQLTDRIYK